MLRSMPNDETLQGVTDLTVEDNQEDDVLAGDNTEFNELASAISEGLCDLSSTPIAPTEVDLSVPLEASEVSFRDGTWMDAICKVLDWLRLPASISIAVQPRDRAARLFEWLDLNDPSQGFEILDDNVVPTLTGLEALADRVGRAISLKDNFVADLDEIGITGASDRWVEGWEEPDPNIGDEPVSAFAKLWSINEFVAKAANGMLNLSPPYQRADVWPTKDAELLIESILRGIPLPSVIILRPEGESRVDALLPYEVVDGKQRLTSIFRFIGKHPDAIRYVQKVDAEHPNFNLAGLFNSDYRRFKRAWKNATGESLTSSIERERYFPFPLSGRSSGLSGRLRGLRGKYFTQIADMTVVAGGESVKVRDLFLATVDYKIPMIEYRDTKPQQIHQVFNLYNRQGKHLNAEEIRNALYQDVHLMRALAVASGDSRDLRGAAPFLAPIEETVRKIQQLIEDYGFGDARYRRTKVLSWLLSMVFVNSSRANGSVNRRSTARQIDLMLDVARDKRDGNRLGFDEGIRDALLLTERAMRAHQSFGDDWKPEFRSGGEGARWQELQLIATLVGVLMAASVLDDDQLEQKLSEARDRIKDMTEKDWLSGGWKRPDKTQTDVQWNYIARVSLGIVQALEVDLGDVRYALDNLNVVSGVAGLESIAMEGS